MSTLYQTDYVAWLAEQAGTLRRLREQRANVQLDLDLLAEDDMGRELRAACASQLTRIILHLLKLQFSPAEWPRGGWENTIRNARDALRRRVTPTIRNELIDELADIYDLACINARNDLAQNHEATAASGLPATCPYTFDKLIDPAWWPDRG